jgi:hypothetical protein
MSELITVKFPPGTKAKLKQMNGNISELIREQVGRLLDRRKTRSAYDKVAHLDGIFDGPKDASTSKDYLKKYGKKNAD